MRSKKLICLVLAVVMLLAMCLPVSAASELELELRLSGELKKGETLTVELLCESSPGLSAAEFTLSYPKTLLKCLGCRTGDALSGGLGVTNPDGSSGAIVAAASASAMDGNGCLAMFSFEVIGEGSGTLSVVEAGFYDANGAALSHSGASLSLSIGSQGTTPPPAQTPTPTPPPQQPEKPLFNDISGHWAEDYLVEGAARGLLQGFPDGSCRPGDTITRGQFVAILWRSMGQPEPSGQAEFNDLNPWHSYYHKAVAWAAEKGYVLGTGNGRFEPDAAITREQVALILFRVSGGVSGGELLFGSIYDEHFLDSGMVSNWAKSGVYWAIYNGVWCGRGSLDQGTRLYPRVSASRAEVVVMMINYQDKVGV